MAPPTRAVLHGFLSTDADSIETAIILTRIAATRASHLRHERGRHPREAPRPRSASGRSASACCWSTSAPPTARMPRGCASICKEFLSDPRVIENQGLLWKLVLNGIILRTRPGRKARDYLKIWNIENNESPLKTITRSQSDKLAAAISRPRPRRGRLGDALRQSVDPLADRGADGAGLRADTGGAALSAIFGRDLGHRVRRGVPRARASCARSRRCG